MMRLILIILLTQTILSQAQANWREQPKWFGIGITIGIAGGDRIPQPTLIAGLGLSKLAWDIERGNSQLDPFTAAYGAYMGSTARIELKKRRKNRVIKPGRLAKRITNRKCWDAY